MRMHSVRLPGAPLLARLGRLLTWCVALLVALAALLILLVALFDWNLAKPWISRQLSTALAREIRVQGPISLSWSLAPATPQSDRSWLPQLHFTARDLQIGNPDWAHGADHLVRASLLDLHFSPLPLLRWHWHITDMRVTGLDLVMERGDDGRKNWRFSDQPRSRWSFDIHQIVFDHALIRYVDQPLDLDLRFDARPLSAAAMRSAEGGGGAPGLVLEAAVSGRYGQADIRGQLRGGPLPDLLNEASVYPLQAQGEVGEVHTVIGGNLINPHQLRRAELQIRLSGESLDRLYAASGVPLPATRAFTTQGALSIQRAESAGKSDGDSAAPAWDWRYERFTGKVGESDFAGDAHYYRGPPRNHLSVTAHADLLRLEDYVPGAGGKRKEGREEGQRPNRVLPDRPAQPQRWAKLDADIELKASRVQLRDALDWQDASTTLRLKDQVLTAAPLRFSMAGGKGDGELTLDGRQNDIQSTLQVNLHAVQVRQLFPKLAKIDASFGKLDGQASLSGSGNSVAAMLASADGRIKADLSQGTISQFILEAAGLNLANAVFAKMYRDQQVKLLCGAADVTIKEGVAQVRHGILNTEDAAIDITGQVDLGQEKLALNVYPRTKQVRILSLRTPLYVRGSFARPDIGASKEGLAARAGAAAALALVAPVAAVIPLITRGQKIPDDCAPHAAADAR